MIVVADAATLLHLSRIGQLELLNTLYHRVFNPVTFWHEAVEHDRPLPALTSWAIAEG